jgi:NadR type nicotinamide-nucleotide adenylyltransferase
MTADDVRLKPDTTGWDRAATGLVLGKFLPPHLGHQFLLDFAAASARELTILVCSLAREPIPGELRAAWVADMCPRARVVHVRDENPQEPHEHPDFWRIWTETIRRHVPAGPDVVFTSEGYGDELARRLGARHVPVDRARELVPTSGTAIRQRPLAHWRYLPPPVRPYFVKRVVVFGPESTGKTTLARDLARHYETVWVSEYARGYLDHKGVRFEPEDFPRFVSGQHAAEDALARQANRVLFCDTDALTTVIFHRLFYGTAPAPLVEAADSRRYDLYLVLDVDVPWVADPQRDSPGDREALRDLYLSELRTRDRPHLLVSGSWAERFDAACAAVDRLLRE